MSMNFRLIVPGKDDVDAVPANGTDYTLEECYKLLSCDLIEVVELPKGRILIVNEEGLLRRLPVNREASLLSGVMIVGPALCCPSGGLR